MSETHLRHSSRHIHHTVADHVEAGLAALNWTDPAATPFGAPVVTFDRTRSAADFLVPGVTPSGLKAGLVTITLGSEFMPDPEEMGSGLVVVELPIFVDIFMDADAHAQTLAEDVRDIFLGRQEFWPKRFIPVVNQATSTPVQGWTIEFDDVERDKPEHAFALAWQVVKATAMVRFQEVGGSGGSPEMGGAPLKVGSGPPGADAPHDRPYLDELTGDIYEWSN